MRTKQPQPFVSAFPFLKPTFLCVCLLLMAVQARAQLIYDAAKDFSTTQNPSGAWSYGWTSGSPAVFHLFTRNPVIHSLNTWQGPFPPAGGDVVEITAPNIFCNTTFSPQSSDEIEFLPGQMTFHPGYNDEKSTIRWRAPFAGFIQIEANFESADFGSTEVFVMKNNLQLFDNALSSYNSTTFSASIAVKTGDYIDFKVGNGDGDFGGDTVRITAKIKAGLNVPTKSAAGIYTGTLLSMNKVRSVRGSVLLEVDGGGEISGTLFFRNHLYPFHGFLLNGEASAEVNVGNEPLKLYFAEVGQRLRFSGTAEIGDTAFSINGQRSR